MGEDPQQLRRDIERTRADLGVALDDIEERVSPARIVERRKQRVRDRWDSIRSSVMGEPDEGPAWTAGPQGKVEGMQQRVGDGVHSVSEGMHSAVETVQSAPGQARRRTQGNPLVAGALAFGAGVLAASLLPPTRAEQEAAVALKERAEPLTEQLKEAGREVGQHLTEAAKEAGTEVAEHAKEAAAEVQDEARSTAQDLTEEGRSRAEDVAAHARDSAQDVTDDAKSSAQSVQDSPGY